MASGVLGASAPIDSGSTRGLEVRLWVVDDTHWDAARALSAGLSTEMPIEPERIERWSDWGFRIVAIPVDRVDGFLGQLRPVQPISVQWLGEFGHWRAIVRAGELGTDHVRVGQRRVEIDRGRPRLIARSWIEPMLGQGEVLPAVRLDLGMQIETHERRVRQRRQMGLLGLDHERSIEDDGPVIDELILSAMLDGSAALIIMGEAPGVDWNELPDPEKPLAIEDDAAQGGEARGDDAQGDRGAGAFGPSEHQQTQRQAQEKERAQAQGERTLLEDRRETRPGPRINQPAKPMGQSLGELMLTSPGSRTTRLNQARIVPKRVIVVLIPRVEGGYSLLPRSVEQAKKKGERP